MKKESTGFTDGQERSRAGQERSRAGRQSEGSGFSPECVGDDCTGEAAMQGRRLSGERDGSSC